MLGQERQRTMREVRRRRAGLGDAVAIRLGREELPVPAWPHRHRVLVLRVVAEIQGEPAVRGHEHDLAELVVVAGHRRDRQRDAGDERGDRERLLDEDRGDDRERQDHRREHRRDAECEPGRERGDRPTGLCGAQQQPQREQIPEHDPGRGQELVALEHEHAVDRGDRGGDEPDPSIEQATADQEHQAAARDGDEDLDEPREQEVVRDLERRGEPEDDARRLPVRPRIGVVVDEEVRGLDVLGLVEHRVSEQGIAVLADGVREAQRERDHQDGSQDQAHPPCVHHAECIAYTGSTKKSPFPVARLAVAAVLVGGFVAIQVIRAGEPLGLDQGLFACFGRWLRDGWIPYRDMGDSKPPLHLYSWVRAWAGGAPAAAWRCEALWLAGTSLLAFAVARRRWGDRAGLAAAARVFVGLWTPGFGGYWSRLQAEELLVLPELAAAWFAISALDRPRAAIACGALVGVVGLYKVPALATGGAWLALWIASQPRREALRRLGLAANGGLGPRLVA